MDAGVKRELEAKVDAGERLTHEDGVALFATDDLAWLGRLAHHKRTALHGDRAMFAVSPQPDAPDACPAGDDSRWAEWSGDQRSAHAEGARTRATMLYGQGEEPQQRVGHLLRLRELQDETGGFAAFVPLRHQHDPDAEPAGGARAVSPAESLKTFAVSRLLFDNVPHVECHWAVFSPALAQFSLNFGADALDGPVTPDAGAEGAPAALQLDDLLELIRDAGFRPVERDSSYAIVREHDGPVPLAERRSEPQQVWA
mgnify:CR=1 FL=1